MPDYKTPERIEVAPNTDGVSCDGGNPALGHPKVWYNFEDGNEVECSYCDRIFVKSS